MNALHLLFGTALSVLLYLLVHKWRNQQFYKMLQSFPSPPTIPIIGNIHMVFGNGRDRVKKLMKIFLNYESPFVMWLSYIPMLVLTKPEDIQTVSSKCIDRDMMGIFEESVGDGITVARAEKWKKTRRLMNPAFSPSMLQQYLIVFNDQVRILKDKLEKEAGTGKMFDLWPYMVNANIDIITENMTGSKLKTQESMGNEFSNALIKTLKLESLRLVLPWLLSQKIFYFYRLLTGNKDLFEKLHKLPKQVLEQKKSEYKFKKSNDENPPRTLIDILFRLRDTNPEFTERQMHDEMLNIIVTGSESTAVIGSFILLMLAMHPNAQKKVYEEAKTILGTENVDVEMENLVKLKYLDQCIKETLRIFTLFPVTLRKTTEEITLNDNRIIPANCQIAMALHGVHLNPSLYPNPKEWNPENFSPEAVESRPKHSFVAFGVGPRSCIGSKYAMMSLKTQVVHIVSKYHINTDIRYTDLRPVMDAIVRNKFGYPVKLTIREETV